MNPFWCWLGSMSPAIRNWSPSRHVWSWVAKKRGGGTAGNSGSSSPVVPRTGVCGGLVATAGRWRLRKIVGNSQSRRDHVDPLVFLNCQKQWNTKRYDDRKRALYADWRRSHQSPERRDEPREIEEEAARDRCLRPGLPIRKRRRTGKND
jgi:hypothetical protein